MSVEITEDRNVDLAVYGEIPISFWVHSVFEVASIGGDPGGYQLAEKPLGTPWFKDYDLPGNKPYNWKEVFDISSWGFLFALDRKCNVGAAAIAWNTPECNMLEGRTDLAVLWDLRVIPEKRHSGIGCKLFAAAADWARERGCTEMVVETQDVNVPACRFYEKQGCTLKHVNPGPSHYPENEIMFLWRLAL